MEGEEIVRTDDKRGIGGSVPEKTQFKKVSKKKKIAVRV